MKRKIDYFAGRALYSMRVAIAEPGRSIPDVAENLGINKDLIYRWRCQLQKTGGIAFPGNGRMALTEERKRIRELEKRLKETEMERDILKKAMAIFSRAPE